MEAPNNSSLNSQGTTARDGGSAAQIFAPAKSAFPPSLAVKRRSGLCREVSAKWIEWHMEEYDKSEG
jgi:hypothetical protein